MYWQETNIRVTSSISTFISLPVMDISSSYSFHPDIPSLVYDNRGPLTPIPGTWTIPMTIFLRRGTKIDPTNPNAPKPKEKNEKTERYIRMGNICGHSQSKQRRKWIHKNHMVQWLQLRCRTKKVGEEESKHNLQSVHCYVLGSSHFPWGINAARRNHASIGHTGNEAQKSMADSVQGVPVLQY